MSTDWWWWQEQGPLFSSDSEASSLEELHQLYDRCWPEGAVVEVLITEREARVMSTVLDHYDDPDDGLDNAIAFSLGKRFYDHIDRYDECNFIIVALPEAVREIPGGAPGTGALVW